jgi:hypothetical protein
MAVCREDIFREEYGELVRIGFKPVVFVNERCKISTPLDMMANQIRIRIL